MNKTVLTVDDSRTMRDMLMLALSDAGYRWCRLRTACTVGSSLRRDADVIVTDINMPRMDGFGFIEGVRSDDRHRTVPILVLTTESDAEKKTAPAAPGNRLDREAFDPVKLVAAIRRVAA